MGLPETTPETVSRPEPARLSPPRWHYLLEFLSGQVSPWDRGVLDAHYIKDAATDAILAELESARRGRQGMLAVVSQWRRRYLDGFIWGLEREIERRPRSD